MLQALCLSFYFVSMLLVYNFASSKATEATIWYTFWYIL